MVLRGGGLVPASTDVPYSLMGDRHGELRSRAIRAGRFSRVAFASLLQSGLLNMHNIYIYIYNM